MPASADCLRSYVSLVTMIWPFDACRLKWYLPLAPFLRTNLPAMQNPPDGHHVQPHPGIPARDGASPPGQVARPGEPAEKAGQPGSHRCRPAGMGWVTGIVPRKMPLT